MTHAPPRLARAILRRCTPAADRDFLIGDLDEEFANRVIRDGRGFARRWYYTQSMLSIPWVLRSRLSRRTSSEPRSPMLIDLRSDLRDAVRRTRRASLTSFTIVLMIALGLGASTAVYTVLRAVLLQPLPFAGSERVVRLQSVLPSLANEASYLPSDSWLDFVDWRASAKSYEVLGGMWEGGTTRAFTLANETASYPVAIVTEHFGELVGVHPILGRSFRGEEFTPEGPRVVALTEQFWRTRFGSDSSVIGRSIQIADTMRTVVAIFNDAYDYPGRVAAWIPVAPVPGQNFATRRTSWLALYGRLRPGVTREAARAELQGLIARTSETESQKSRQARIIPLTEILTGPVRPVLLLLSAVVAVTLIVAAGNVALLLLAQAEARTRDLAIRMALGSEISRLARKLAVESILLAGAGGLLGVILARGLISTIVAFYPGRFVRAEEVSIGPPVLFAVTVATVIVGLSGTWPLLRRLRHSDLVTGLREGAMAASPRAMRVRQVLAIGQLAFAVALVTSGGLLARTFIHLARENPGFNADRVAYVNVSASAVRYPDRQQLLSRLDGAEDAVRAMAGVRGAASVSYLPLPSRVVGWGTDAVRADDPEKREHSIQFRQMSPGYFRVMGVPILRGRGLDSTDQVGASLVAVINETLAKEAFPDVNPLGYSVIVQHRTYTVVGVASDMRYWGLAKPVVGEVFVLPTAQTGLAFRSIVFTPAGDANAGIAVARAAIRAADPTVVISSSGTLSDRVTAASAPERFRAVLVGSLATIALVLAGLGLFAVSAHAVARRTRDIGIRVALGATRSRVQGAVFRESLVLGIAGTVAGLGLAWAAARGLRGFLVGVSGMDVAMCATVAAIFLVTSLVASLAPAIRASRVDPLIAMRGD